MQPPANQPHFHTVRRVALHALVGGAVLTAMKFAIFFSTNSVAVLSDAFESIINVAAAAVMLYALWYSNRPADRTHPYGHGKIEFMAVGLEGWLILLAAVAIGVEGVRRLVVGAELERLDVAVWLLGGVGLLNGMLGAYVWTMGRKYANPVLLADGKHLLTDVLSTAGVVAGLLIVNHTGLMWLDPVVAMVVAGFILWASWRLLWQSFHGLMDQSDPANLRTIEQMLEEEQQEGTILGYHKVRHRRAGGFHWIDLHVQVPGQMSVASAHELASRIERRIEDHFGRADATAHVEPASELGSSRDQDQPEKADPIELADEDQSQEDQRPG